MMVKGWDGLTSDIISYSVLQLWLNTAYDVRIHFAQCAASQDAYVNCFPVCCAYKIYSCLRVLVYIDTPLLAAAAAA